MTLASALLLLLAASPPYDRVVSVVDDRVITASDLAFEEALSARDISPFPPFEQGSDALARLEDYRILRPLAADVEAFRPDPEQVEARLAALREGFGLRQDYVDFLARWGMDEAALREQIYARMVVERFVIRNLGLTAADLADPAATLARYEQWMAPRREAAAIRHVPLIEVSLGNTPPPGADRPPGPGRAPDR